MLYLAPKKFQVHEVCGSNPIRRRPRPAGVPSLPLSLSLFQKVVWKCGLIFPLSLSPLRPPLPTRRDAREARESISLCRLSTVGRRPHATTLPSHSHSRAPPPFPTRSFRVQRQNSGVSKRGKMQNLFFNFSPASKMKMNETLLPCLFRVTIFLADTSAQMIWQVCLLPPFFTCRIE